MTNVAIGKIAKVINGLPHYAEVELDIEDGSGTIICRCSGAGFQGQGIVEDAASIGYDDWKKSARDGVIIGLQMASIDVETKMLAILRISGLDATDTNPDIVCCAAIVAVWNSIKYQPKQIDNDIINEILKNSWVKFRSA